jgi:CubicO group peptidase (beta-lactamase class C family)
MRMDTIFDLASCSKVAGGTPAALLMVEDGKLKLDEPVAARWPEFGANGKQDVTLRDLLTHVSGLKAYESLATVEKSRRPDESHVQALYRHYAALPLAYPPRSKMLYSCLNLQTVAALVQSVADEPLEEMLRRRIWNPLGMKDTTYRPSGRKLARCAPTAVGPDGQPVRGKVHDPLAAYHGWETLCPGNAGLYSTAGDLSRYAEMILGEGRRRGRRVLEPGSVRLMTSVQTPPGVTTLRSVGWGVYDKPPFAGPGPVEEQRRTIGHTGYTGTWMWLDPGSQAYVILLTNRVFPSPATNGGEGRSIDRIRASVARTVVAYLAARAAGR